MIILGSRNSGDQHLYAFEYEGKAYFVRFVRRGSRLDCSGVFKFEVEGERVEPAFTYQLKHLRETQRVIKAARKQFNKDYDL